jgi:hypothetical protein
VRTLSEAFAQARALTLQDVVGVLVARASDMIRRTPVSVAKRVLIIVGAGFEADGRNVTFTVTNTVVTTAGCIEGADTFRADDMATNSRFLRIDGNEVAAPQVQARLAAVSRSGVLETLATPDIVASFVQEIRKASGDPTSGGTIGTNCMSLMLYRNGEAEAAYHPDDNAVPIMYSPHLVGGGLTVLGAVIRNGWRNSPSAGVALDAWPPLPVTVDIQCHGVVLVNAGHDDLTDVRIDINGQESDMLGAAKGYFYASGYVYRLPSLLRGVSSFVPFMAFAKGECTALDVRDVAVQELRVIGRLSDDRFGHLRVR